jgi:hypothetical protein
LLVFKDENFECLRNAEAVVQLLWEDHRTIELVVSSIELDQWDISSQSHSGAYSS